MARTAGEMLVDLALTFRGDKVISLEGLTCAQVPEIEGPLALAKLALDFHKRGPGFVFRAIFEEWTQERIVREVY